MIDGSVFRVESRGKLLISEIFGPTLQGEGPLLGRPVIFLRLGACNLQCSWCDTAYTWDFSGKNGVKFDQKTELSLWTIEEVLERMGEISPTVRGLVISGGEPLLQQHHFHHILKWAKERELQVEIETNGTIAPSAIVSYFRPRLNVSPKLSHSGNEIQQAINIGVLQFLADRFDSIFKFVVESREDFTEIDQILSQVPVSSDRIYIMPLGTLVEEQLRVMRAIASGVVERGWNLTPRLHTLIWGNQRGR